MLKKTLVLGASVKRERYSNMAIRRLLEHGHPVVGVGLREGEVEGVKILVGMPSVPDVDTITVYMNANNQKEFESYMLSLNPKRIVFNPGAENPSFAKQAEEKGITTEEACTLVMLSIGDY